MRLIRVIGIFFLANFLFLCITPKEAKAGMEVDCFGTIRAWQGDVSLRDYMATHDCSCPSKYAQPICTKKFVASPPTGGYYGGRQNMQIQMMQGILQPFFNNLFAPPDTSGQDEIERQNAIKRQQEEEQKKMEEERKKQEALKRWQTLQEEEAARKNIEDKQKQKTGQELLTKTGTASGGRLLPFKWEKGKESELQFQPIGTGIYDTSTFLQWQRLLCSTYFSGNAVNAIKSGNGVQARYLNEQADKVMSGQMTDVECRFPAIPEPPDPGKPDAKIQKLQNILSSLQKDVKSLQDIETKLYDLKTQIKEAESKKEAAQIKLEEAQNIAATAKPEEKPQADDLLAEAQAALQSAEGELAKAKQSENDMIKEKEKVENELKNMNAKIQAGGE